MYQGEAIVAKIINSEKIVINRGRNDGIEPGQRFQLYEDGEDIIDPETKESLGCIEIIKGTGKAIHVQDKMTTIASDMKAAPSKTIRRNPSSMGTFLGSSIARNFQEEEILPPETIDFEDPKIGDRVRAI